MASFLEAKAKCNAEGGRLWQPRNAEAWANLLSLEEDILSIPSGHFPFNGQITYIAIGLDIKIEDGSAVAYYTDGTKVPENLIGEAFVWDATYPMVDANRLCVAITEGKLRNVPCAGYAEGIYLQNLNIN